MSDHNTDNEEPLCGISDCSNLATREDYVDSGRFKIPVCDEHYIERHAPAKGSRNPESNKDTVIGAIPTKSSGELEEILDELATTIHNLVPGDVGSFDRVLVPIIIAKVKIEALHTTQTTKLQADLSWCLGKLRGLEHPAEHLEREHKIGEDHGRLPHND